MQQFIRVTMPDYKVFDIPAKLIAEDRARYYASKEPTKEEAQRVFEEEYAITLADQGELLEWANNNINWEDIADQAVLVEQIFPPVNYNTAWCNADKKVVHHE